MPLAEGGVDRRVQGFVKFPPAVFRPVHAERQKLTLLADRHAAVEDQVVVAHQVHPAFAFQVGHLLPQRLALEKRQPQLRHARFLLVREFVGRAPVHRRQVPVAQGVNLALDLDGTLLRVHPVQQPAVFEVERRVALDGLAFQLELDDRHRLLHARHRQRIADALAQTGEKLGPVVVVHVAHQLFQRRQRDAVAHLQLEEPLVAQAHPQRVGDARFLPQARPHPRHVVVAPRDRHVRLAHHVLDHLVDARTAVPEVPRHDQLRKQQVADDPRHHPQERQFLPVGDELVEHPVDVVVAALEVRGEQQFEQQRLVKGREHFFDRLQPVRLREPPQQFEFQPRLPVQELPPRRGVGQPLRQQGIGLARIVDHVEQVELFARRQPLAERLLHERTQAARGVVDDVDELLELAVYVADDVDGALRQRQRAAQARDGGQGGVDVRVLRAERPQVDERLVIHGKVAGKGAGRFTHEGIIHAGHRATRSIPRSPRTFARVSFKGRSRPR